MPPNRAPESRFLTTPEQLLDFDPEHVDCVSKCWVPLAKVQKARGQRLLACHDMRGGYLEDRLVQGGTDVAFYYFRHWHAIDLFVYFSHHLVTIPPVGWVTAGHRHGVPVLGTFITEWDQGADYCRRLFGSLDSAERVAAQLASIAQAYGFDGWLINIENKLELEHVPNMLHFLRVLTATLREVSPMAEVVWYDAVTIGGELKWQDTLNDLNRLFFEASTALFVNYTWREETPAQVRAEAGERSHDVFMGIDVFGRNTYYGPGPGCSIALHAAKAAGLSAALFAFALPFDQKPAGEPWQEEDGALWATISAAWNPQQPVFSHLPLYTDFSVGAGRSTKHLGALLDRSSWYNLARQGLQPSLRVVELSLPGLRPLPLGEAGPAGQGMLRAATTLEACYSGGSCMEIAGALQGCQQLSLLSTAIRLPHGGLEVGYAAAACSGRSAAPVLALTLSSVHVGHRAGAAGHVAPSVIATEADTPEAAMPGGHTGSGPGGHSDEQGGDPTCLLLLLPEGQAGAGARRQLESLVVAASSCHIAFLLPSRVEQPEATGEPAQQGQPQHEQELPWVRRQYVVRPPDLPAAPGYQWQLGAVELLVVPEEGCHEVELYLGELWLEEPACPNAPPCRMSGLACSGLQLHTSVDGAGTELAALLAWDVQPATRCCHVYCSLAPGEAQQWLGVACGGSFHVHGVAVPAGTATVTFTVLPLSESAGRLQPWHLAASVTVALGGVPA